jgi:two-component system sensor histidine kinase VicK
LTLEYLQADRIDIKLSRLDFISRIKTIFETYKLADKDLTKNFILNSESEKVYIEVDELKFMLIFSNLISNAYKFTKDEGKITVTVKENEDSMLVCVADDGIGIPEKLQPHIFEKFTIARRPGLHGEKPVGLGLHIIKSMVEIHHGKIWFESKEGEGTKFFVEIPKFLSREMDKLAGIPDPTEL